MLSVYNNTLASTAATYVDKYTQAVNSSIEKLSSGKKVNSAADAPGETGFNSKFQAAIISNKKMTSNIQDLISQMQTADSAITGLGGVEGLLASVREKIIASQNSTLTANDKQELQNEIEDFIDEIGRVTDSTEFNTMKLLNGNMIGSVTSSNADLGGYVTKKLDASSSYAFTDITGASYHQLENSVDAAVTTGTTTDYTDSDGAATLLVSSGTTVTGTDYELIFSNSTDFNVYNSSGTLITSSSVNDNFTIDGLTMIVSSSGTISGDDKINFTTGTGATALTTNDGGNRGSSVDLSSASWDGNVMMHSYFDIKFDYDGSTLKYAAFNKDGEQMGDWAAEGSEFTSYSDSKLSGSSFTFSATGSAKGDIWRLELAAFDSLETAGGTFVIDSPDGTTSIAYDGDDRLSDVAASINSLGDGIVTATFDNDADDLTMTAVDKGVAGKLRIYDSSGDFASTLSFSTVSSTGTDATLTYQGETFTSSTGYFNSLIDGLKIEVADTADIPSGQLSVTNRSKTSATNFNGGAEIEYYIKNLTPESLGLKTVDGNYTIDVTSNSGSDSALTLIDSVQDSVSLEAARVGSTINALSSHVSYLQSTTNNYEEVYSNHTDTNFAEESTNYYTSRALLDTASAMEAQANLIPSRVLALLGIT